MYADLEGGDMLFVGPWINSFRPSPDDLWSFREVKRAAFGAVMVADLSRVTHLVFSPSSYECNWLVRINPPVVPPRNLHRVHHLLKEYLARFKSLKKISLVCNWDDPIWMEVNVRSILKRT
jgi:hypothetical protein